MCETSTDWASLSDIDEPETPDVLSIFSVKTRAQKCLAGHENERFLAGGRLIQSTGTSGYFTSYVEDICGLERAPIARGVVAERPFGRSRESSRARLQVTTRAEGIVRSSIEDACRTTRR